ncbi:MAG TPA: circadian clock KaiB family protein [Rhodocyclaceae bacterium]
MPETNGAVYRFRLFIAGEEANSRLAERNLRALCELHLSNRHHIEVVDVLQDFEATLAAGILVAPAVVLTTPRTATLFGTLADEAKVLRALGLHAADPA